MFETHQIINKVTGAVVQTDTERNVYRNCATLNDHEVKNGRPPNYVVKEVPHG